MYILKIKTMRRRYVQTTTPLLDDAVGRGASRNYRENSLLTPEQVLKMNRVRNRFGNLGVAAEYYLILDELKQQVMPVKYYACPADWGEYRQVGKQAVDDAQVLWIKTNGNFCLPPHTPEPPEHKVNAIPESIEQTDSDGEEEEDIGEDEANGASRDTALDVTNVNESLAGLEDQMKQTLEPDSVFKTTQAHARAKNEQKQRLERLDELHTLRAKEIAQQQIEEDIAELKKIMKTMPTYKELSERDLAIKANEYYKLAQSCSPQIVNGEREEHAAHMDACASNDNCVVIENTCAPKSIVDDIEENLAVVQQSAETSFSTDDDLHAVSDLANWWKKHYRDSANESEIEKLNREQVTKQLLTV